MPKKMTSNTLWMLMAEFSGRPAVTLEECKHYLGYSTVAEANRAADNNKLPVPTFRNRDSQRSKRMVHLDDIAKLIDDARQKATNSWNAANGITEPDLKDEKPKRRKRSAA